MRLALLSTVFLAALALQPVHADDVSLYAGTALTFAPGGDKAKRDDFNAYVEADLANFYLGASADFYNDKLSNEVDLSLGYRNTTAAGLSYDLSYTRNYYPNDGGDCCGDVDVSLSTALTDKVTGTFEWNYYPEDKTYDAYVTLDYALNDKITMTGSVGVIQNPGAPDTKDMELAIKYALGAETAAKLHYYDGSDYKGYFALDLTWDTTLLGG